MKYLLNIIQPENNLTEKLDGLFTKYSNVDPNALGMKINWQNEPLWAYKILRKVEIERNLSKIYPGTRG
jgi:regulatory protein YycH of two-component signal transduction system YycFG